MALLTFESPNSARNIANKIVVTDTSYLVTLSDTNDPYYSTFTSFHNQAVLDGTNFFINVIVRQEFIKQVRKAQLIEAILALASSDPGLEARYKNVAGITRPGKTLTASNLNAQHDEIFKDHVRQGDYNILVNALRTGIWDEAKRIENTTSVNYVSDVGQISWEDLGALMNRSGLAPTDCMIANFAFFIQADAIVTKGGCSPFLHKFR